MPTVTTSRRRASRDAMMIIIIGWGLVANHDPSVGFLES